MKNKKKFLSLVLALVASVGTLSGIGKVKNVPVSAANLSVSGVNSIISSAEDKVAKLYDIDVNGVQAQIAKTRGYLNSSDMNSATDAAYDLLAMTGESQPVTARSVWHRPTEKSLAELQASLDVYEEIGINLVFVETFYHGYSMFKSEYVPYYAGFENADYGEYEDYLDAFSSLAAERGIETHAWVENFYVGINPSAPFVQNHQNWLLYNDEVQTIGGESSLTYLQRLESGYIFIDPANKAVCNFLVNYYKELLEKNPLVKGLNLDYIRYPLSTQSQDTGYTKAAMIEFAQSVGVDLEKDGLYDKVVDTYQEFKQKVLSVSGNYSKWCNYRRSKITNFVERIYLEVKSEYDIVLSTAVFSSVNDSYEKKKQDWQTWYKNGWIDVATPMAYLDTAAQVKSAVQTMKNLAGETCYYYTGLASSYRKFPAYENVNQIQASYDAGANGYAIFCATQLLDSSDSVNVQRMLKLGFNSKKAVLPHASADKVVKAYFDAVKDRADRLYIPAGVMTAQKKSSLAEKLDEILAMNMQTAAELALVKAKVTQLNTAGYGEYASGYAQARIAELMKNLEDLLVIKVNRATSCESLPKPPESSSSSSSSSSETSSSSSSSSTESSSSSTSSSEPASMKFSCASAVGVGYIPTAIFAAAVLRKRKRK